MLPFIDATKAFEFLKIQERPVRADAIFILGSGSLGPVNRAAGIYRDICANLIAFTSVGGKFGGNIVFGKTEMEKYAEQLMENGIPFHHLAYPLTHEGTTNTLVEAQVAIRFITSKLGLAPTRVILCSRGVHQRRACATFKRWHPDVEFINCPDDELMSVELLPRIVQEIDRLVEYGAKGDLVPQEIPGDVREICEQIRAHLKE